MLVGHLAAGVGPQPAVLTARLGEIVLSEHFSLPMAEATVLVAPLLALGEVAVVVVALAVLEQTTAQA